MTLRLALGPLELPLLAPLLRLDLLGGLLLLLGFGVAGVRRLVLRGRYR